MSTRIELNEKAISHEKIGLMKNRNGAVVFITVDGDIILLVSAEDGEGVPRVENDITLNDYVPVVGSITIFSS